MDILLKYCRSLTTVSDESWNILQPALKKKEFKKGEFLLRQGQICNSLFYIDSGYCKSYYEMDGVFKNTETLGRNCIRVFATKQEEFSNLFKLYSPQQRLEYLETKYPEILQRVPLAQLCINVPLCFLQA